MNSKYYKRLVRSESVARKIMVEENVKIKSKKSNNYPIIITIFLVLSILGIIVLAYSYYNYSQTIGKKISNYIEQRESAESDLDYVTSGKTIYYSRQKFDFFDENIVFVLKGYGNVYYSYDCVQQITSGEEYEYWAYNKEAAISQGYKKGSC